MNADPVVIVVAAVALVIFLVVLVLLFFNLRLWLQAALTHTPVSFFDIIRMRLRKCPPTLLVHALIALKQRGITLPAHEAEGLYLAAVVRGERVATATELADLIESVKRNTPPAQP